MYFDAGYDEIVAINADFVSNLTAYLAVSIGLPVNTFNVSITPGSVIANVTSLSPSAVYDVVSNGLCITVYDVVYCATLVPCSTLCFNHARCHVDPASGNVTCICAAGFTGPTCLDVIPPQVGSDGVME